MLGGEAETEALEVWGPAGLSYTPAKKIPPPNREKREDPYWGCPLTSPCVSRPMCAYTHTWTHTQLSFKVSKAGIGCLLCRPRKQWLMGHLEGSLQFTWYSPKALLVKTKSFEHISPPCCTTFGSWPHFRIIISWGYEILTNHLFPYWIRHPELMMDFSVSSEVAAHQLIHVQEASLNPPHPRKKE